MEQDFWLKRWENGETGFHQDKLNPYLGYFYGEKGPALDKRQAVAALPTRGLQSPLGPGGPPRYGRMIWKSPKLTIPSPFRSASGSAVCSIERK